jgi:hypothetical protein
MTEDVDALAALPDGTLSIDVLTGSAAHSVNGAVTLYIAGELHAWLLHRLSEASIDRSAIKRAVLTAAIRTDRVATKRKRVISFEFVVDSTIVTSGREYRGNLCETHEWHSGVPFNKRVQATRETRAPDA